MFLCQFNVDAEPKTMAIQLILFSHSEIFNSGLNCLIKKFDGIEIIGTADNYLTPMKMCENLDVDVAILAVNSDSVLDRDFICDLSSQMGLVKIVIITTDISYENLKYFVSRGINVFISILCNKNELESAINAAANNDLYISNVFKKKWKNEAFFPLNSVFNRKGLLGNRELQVLTMIAEGYSSKKIATKLEIATGTVHVHRRNIMRKLELKNVPELIKYAIREKIVDY